MVLNELLERTRQRQVPRQAVRWRVGSAPSGLFAYAHPAKPDGRGIGGWPVAAIDVETTGLGRQARIVEIAVVRVEPDGRLREYATLLNPGRDPGPVFIHQITASQVRNAPRFADVAGDVLAMLDGAVVAAHNASFEDRFLTAELDRCGLTPAAMPAVCTLEFARHGLPRLPNHKLATVADACGVVLDGAHTALGDARAVSGMLASLVEHITPELPVAPTVQGFVPTRVRPVTRTGRFNKGEGWMVSLLNRLPLTTGDHEPLEVDAYLEALDKALTDGRLIGTEARMLARAAGEAGLGQDVVRGLHHRYLDACRDAALEDDVLTPAELQQLNSLSQLLGEPDYFADLSPTPGASEEPRPPKPEPRKPDSGPAKPASPEPASLAAEPPSGPARPAGKLGDQRVWFSPACPTELARAVVAAGGRRAVYLTRSCVAAVIAPADSAHPAHERATALGIPVLTPDSAWPALELTPAVSRTSATLEASATTDEAVIRGTLVALGLTPATLEPAPAADRGGSKTDAAVSPARTRDDEVADQVRAAIRAADPHTGQPDQGTVQGVTLDQVPAGGPTVSRPDRQAPPVPQPSPVELFTIHTDGTLERHIPPPEPSWPGQGGPGQDGQDGFGDGVVWVLCPDPPSGEPWARLQRREMLQRLAPAAAELMDAMEQKGPPVRARPGISLSRIYVNAAWNSLLRRAFFTLSGQRGRHPWIRDHPEQPPVRRHR